jgi:hypothetical protein
MAHVFTVDTNTFNAHLKYLFAAAGVGLNNIVFQIDKATFIIKSLHKNIITNRLKNTSKLLI